MTPIELNSKISDADPAGSPSNFQIDLNETPVCSPRELAYAVELSLEGGDGCRAGLLDINALPPSEEETGESANSGPSEQVVENRVMKSCFPPGNPLSSKLPQDLIGDVFQSWQFMWRFAEVLGLEKPLSFKELEEELIYGHSSTLGSSSSSTVVQENEHACVAMETESLKEAAHVKQASNTNSGHSGVALVNVLCSLLKVLLGELQSKVATFVDSNFDGGETKSRRRRKKDVDSSTSAKKEMLDLLPLNGLTWPELARRYVLTVSSMEGNLDSVDLVNHENGKGFHCIQGNGRTIRGSLPAVDGMEADALFLAEATKQIFGAQKSETHISSVDYNESDATVGRRTVKVNDTGIPEWAQVLEPVRKLPTNVGARIRKCVYEALNKRPPEWAKKRLEHSISKEVYKGNASGPTKKAVLSVLADICGETQPQKPNRKRKNRCFSSVSDVIMKQCRKVLYCAAAVDEDKVFCNFLGRNTSDNDDEGILGFRAMVSRPLDFRTIDLKLASGAYSGSHEAFLNDVREVWLHMRTAYADQSDLLQLAEKLSQAFEVLYEKEVLSLVQKFSNYPNIDSLNSEAKKEIEAIFESASEIPKAPWDEGVCKVCGIDKDDDNVLLCDTCDSEYHTYCLTPALARVPEGNWYCPSCVAGHCNYQYNLQVPQVISRSQKRRYRGEFTHGFMEPLSHLAATMEMKDYWEYTARERIFLLKFFCDELLNSAVIRGHLEQCASFSAELQQKLQSLYLDWRHLSFRQDNITGKAARIKSGMQPLRGRSHFSLVPGDLVLPQSHISSNTVRSHVAEHIYAKHVNCENQLPGHHGIVQPDTNESKVCDIGSELKNLQDSIARLESQHLAVSLRKELLGRDSAGRLYWAFSSPGTSPWLVVHGTILLQQEKDIPTSSWFFYQSESEIEEVVECLAASDANEREVAESILRWQRVGYKDSNKTGHFVEDESLHHNGLVSNALLALEKKHGPCLELEASKFPMSQCQIAKLTSTMYRCECLEPIWPSRCHCCLCHWSFLSRQELDEHNDGRCNLGASASQSSNAIDGIAKEKGMTRTEKLVGEFLSGRVKHDTGLGLSEFSKESAGPYDNEEISTKFVTESSIRELVQEIVLTGPNGIPSFVPSASHHLSDPDLENRLKCPVIRRCIASGNDEEVEKNSRLNPTFVNGKRDHSLIFRSQILGFGNDSSLRPLTGRSIQIIRQLKINLLDMDAAVPEEALRSSKTCWGKRCAWRAFVKSAKSIFELVQAIMVFEDMIETEDLRNGWWYRSSISSAANIATVSSLALRVYSLDAAIVYERPSTSPVSASTEIPEQDGYR